jgi:hypothetical protein
LSYFCRSAFNVAETSFYSSPPASQEGMMLFGSSNVFLGKFATSLSCFFISGTRFSILNFFTITAILAPAPAEPAK